MYDGINIEIDDSRDKKELSRRKRLKMNCGILHVNELYSVNILFDGEYSTDKKDSKWILKSPNYEQILELTIIKYGNNRKAYKKAKDEYEFLVSEFLETLKKRYAKKV